MHSKTTNVVIILFLVGRSRKWRGDCQDAHQGALSNSRLLWTEVITDAFVAHRIRPPPKHYHHT